MGGPLSYPAHISAVSALIKDTGQIGSWLDWEAHAIPRFRRFRDEIVRSTAHPPTPNPAYGKTLNPRNMQSKIDNIAV